jgi:hypothetical protein
MLKTVIVAGLAALLLAGCSSSTKNDAKPLPSSVPSLPAGTSPAGTSAIGGSSAPTSAPAGADAPIAVNKTITDPLLGDKVVVLKLVRNFPVPATYPAIKDDEIVLVDVTITAGTKYYTSLASGSFRLIPDDTNATGNPTSIAGPEMKTKGYPPLPDAGASTGKTATGWVAFTLARKGSKSLTLRFERLAAQGSDGTRIPAKNFDLVLVK